MKGQGRSKGRTAATCTACAAACAACAARRRACCSAPTVLLRNVLPIAPSQRPGEAGGLQRCAIPGHWGGYEERRGELRAHYIGSGVKGPQVPQREGRGGAQSCRRRKGCARKGGGVRELPLRKGAGEGVEEVAREGGIGVVQEELGGECSGSGSGNTCSSSGACCRRSRCRRSGRGCRGCRGAPGA